MRSSSRCTSLSESPTAVLAQPGRSSRCAAASRRTVAAFCGKHDAELLEQATHAVDRGRALLDQALAHAVHAQPGLLVLALDRHEAHVRSLHCLADRLRRRPRRSCRACRSCGRAPRTSAPSAERCDRAARTAAPSGAHPSRPPCRWCTPAAPQPARAAWLAARSGRMSTALPCSSTPCTAKTFLARSIPTYRMAMDFPFRVS